MDGGARCEFLCLAHTELSPAARGLLCRLTEQLPLFGELSQSDVFIDVLDRSGTFAWVVGQGGPKSAKSLYATSVVGEMALAQNEPGVLHCLTTGAPSLGMRGISQEGVPMRQRVIPILDEGRVIGSFILETDITEEVRQEHEVARLTQTTARLSETLLQLLSETNLAQLMDEGLLILGAQGGVTYANETARRLLGAEGAMTLLGKSWSNFGQTMPSEVAEEVHIRDRQVVVRAVPLQDTAGEVGSLVLLKDVTEIREKESRLTIKDTVIQEMHHRVKNNLQMMASLLRLQIRRTNSDEVRNALGEAVTRLYAIASVHEALLVKGEETVPLREVACSIIKHLDHLIDLRAGYVTVTLEGDALHLPLDRATSVALCINELIQNALVHAFPEGRYGQIQVRLLDLGQNGRVSVSDNGVGLQRGPTAREASLGLQIVESLITHDLKGTFRLSDGPGLVAEMIFPKGVTA